MNVERDVVLEESREDVQRKVDDGPVREVVEDLALEHVDHAVGEVRQSLGGIRLFLEALNSPVGASDHDAELADVRHALHRQGRDPAVAFMGLSKGGQVDVGERVAGHHEERLAPEEIRNVANPPRGAQELLLVSVGEVDAQRRSVADPLPNGVREPVEVGDHLGESMAGKKLQDVLHHGPVDDRHHRLRHLVGEWPQPRSEAGRHHHCAHQWAAGSM